MLSVYVPIYRRSGSVRASVKGVKIPVEVGCMQRCRIVLTVALGLACRGITNPPAPPPPPAPPLPVRSVFPADNAWNRDISADSVDPHSDSILARCGAPEASLHPDFGTLYHGAPWGIPFITVLGSQPRVPVTFTYADESDPGPYPIPAYAPIEGGPLGSEDRHVLVVDVDNWKLYELFDAHPVSGGVSWTACSGAIFDLASNAVRPDGWTSADAAGLPIFPGLVRYEEATTGRITHAFRFTCPVTRRAYVPPARHFASVYTDSFLPPMGMRVRLKG